MRRLVYILLPVILIVDSCTKDSTVPTSGTVTLDNVLSFNTGSQAYFAFGFLFSAGDKVSTLSTPQPDITVDSDGTNLFLATNNYRNSFYKYGEYSGEPLAIEAFKNLAEVSVTQWVGMASPLKTNQVWIYRSGSDHYAKIRIISLVSDVRDGRDYAECTFEWVYQPDGTPTFQGK